MYLLAKKRISKLVTCFSIFMLVFGSFFTGVASVPVPTASAVQPVDDLCEVAVDVVLIMDRSGSMTDGEAPSRCEWYEYEPPSCVPYVQEGVSEEWCATQESGLPCTGYSYTPASQSKINAAKDAAKAFVNNMGVNDQSALVSFSDFALLNQALSGNHSATKSAVDSLVSGGATNIGDAINFGIGELVSERANPQATKVMILLTDGKANKPNGYGYDEYPADVTYAESKAEEAANLGYKIFTIGLGSNGDINEGMLQNIANTTGATYHHAPSGDDLTGIYEDISQQICEYGSVSGCKYNDVNNNGEIDQDELTISDWEINLNNGVATTTQTTIDGCYTFSGLEDGDYTISETPQLGWAQTYPQSESYAVTIAGHNDVADQDFANYYPECGNSIDDAGEECDDGNLDDGDGCSSQCVVEIADPECGNNIQEDGEDCDDGNTDDDDGCSAQCIIEISDPVCGNSTLEAGEECDDGNLDDGDGCSSQCVITYQCNDGVDNDIDGKIDYSDDPGCDSGTDNNETDAPEGIQPGDIVINEIMQNPGKVSDIYGEWFELYNNSDKVLDLQGCEISDNNGNLHIIGSSLLISQDGYIVLVRDDDTGSNGGVSGDYKYTSFVLGNLADEVVLTCNGVEIDRVEYNSGFPIQYPGKSMILSNPNLDNNVGSNWCESSSTYGAGDSGTPGAVNDACGGIDCVESEDDRMCVSDGYATVYYSWNDPTCGGVYNQEEPDTDCNCDYSPWVDGACVSSTQREQTRNNLTEHTYCTDTTQNVADASCGTGPPILPGYLKIWKYKDMDGSTENPNSDIFPVSDWSFTVDSGATSSTATTTVNGYALFSVVPGNHTVTEEVRDNWYLLNDELQGHSFNVATDQTVEVSYYNTEYSTISGYKHEDMDGDSETAGDRVLKSDWLINLFNSSSDSIPVATTTTDVDGYYEFNGLIPGDYTVIEDSPTYWTALSATSSSFTLISGTATTTNFINYYDGPEGYIFGCKYDDVNNNGVLDDGEEKVGGFEMVLEREEESSFVEVDRQSTESDEQSEYFGCYRFTELVSGDYKVSETAQNGWSQTYPIDPLYYAFNLVEEVPTTTIDFYNYYSGYCGDNIVNGEEECDGSAPDGYQCNSSCILEEKSSGGGGGSFTSRPDVELDLTYDLIKEVGEVYTETIVVSNTGNIILTNEILTVDLPEDKLSFVGANPAWTSYTTSTQVATWDMSALSVGSDQIFAIEVLAENEGEAITQVSVVFDQANDMGSMLEDIFFAGVGGGPEEEEGGTGGGEEGGAVGGTGTTGGTPTGGTPEEIEVSSAATTDETEKENGEVAGDDDKNGEVLGTTKCDDGSLWWMWLLVALVHVIVLAVYYYFLASGEDDKEGGAFDPGEETDSKFDKPKENEENDKFQFKGSWIWWWPGILGMVVIFLILFLIGNLSALPLALVLLAYFGTLFAMHWLMADTSDVARRTSVAVLATLAPVITLIFCQGFSPMGWVGVIIIYALCALAFILGLTKKDKVAFNLLILSIVAVSVLVFVLEYLIYWCKCF